MYVTEPTAKSDEKPFEELAREWGPRAKRFLALLANQLTLRVKARLPGVLSGSAFLIFAVFCMGGIVAWLSAAAWSALQEQGFSTSVAALIVAGSFAVLAIACAFIGKKRALHPGKPAVEVLEPETRELEDAGQELITLFKDLTIAAKRSLSPNEVLKPHAVKLAIAGAAVGLLVALNVNARKDR